MSKKRYSDIFVVLTYRNTEDILDFLKSAKEQVKDYRVIIVNSFYDEESDRKFAEIAAVHDCDFLSVENKGYGCGNNRGIEYALEHYEFDRIVISNPDIVIENYKPESDNFPTDGLVGGKIINLHGKRQNPLRVGGSKLTTNAAYYYYCKNNAFLFLLGVAMSKISRLAVVFFHKKKPAKVYAVHGSFLVIPQAVLKQVGTIFDENIFMFGEELDLAERLKKAGIPTYYVPRIKVLHKEDGSVKLSDFNLKEKMKVSCEYVYNKHNLHEAERDKVNFGEAEMKVQVLVATMNQTDHSLLDKLNIKSDVIVGNQCDYDSVERFDYNGHRAVYLNFAERGVGLNRNNALMRADGDICLFADDDMVYEDDYVEKLCEAFQKNPKADVIVFNLNEPYAKGELRYKIPKTTRLNRLNYLRYGTARVAVRLKSVKENGIYFNQCFGGGTEHCHGEDSLFLTACLDKKLRMVAVPVAVATLLENRESTWGGVDNDTYIKDQGCLYYAISKRWWRFLCLQDAFRHHKSYNCSFWKAYRMMVGTKRNK